MNNSFWNYLFYPYNVAQLLCYIEKSNLWQKISEDAVTYIYMNEIMSG
jgi:hypothetical protein